MKRVLSIVLAAALVVLAPSCATLKGLGIGTAAGTIIGAGVGALIGGNGHGAAVGAAIGAGVGAATGTTIGAIMDKKAKELEAVEGAKVTTITDINGLQAIQVTFSSGILFDTNSATLSEESKAALKDFSAKMADLPMTDITIMGHTDNTGSLEVNQRLSQKRAEAVKKCLKDNGFDEARLSAIGKAYEQPVADNGTAEGRAQNRRVEIYVTATADMVAAAEAGKL